MEYMFLLNSDEKQRAAMSPQTLQEVGGAYLAYTDALKAAGVFVEGNRLEATTTATTVRVKSDGTTAVADGPYAETKEQLAGYYVVDVPGLDAAISWAARCPGASHGVIEIRPVGAVTAAA